jgi:O-antigen ligase
VVLQATRGGSRIRRPPAARKRRDPREVAAVAGILSAACLLLWILLAWLLADGSTPDMAAVGLLTGAAFLGVRLLGARESRAAPMALVFALAAFAAARIHLVYEGPISGPLGYSNAAGSLFMLGSAAAALWLVRASENGPRLMAAVMMILFASVPWMNRTRTATLLLFLLPLALLAAYVRRPRPAITASAALLAATLASTIILGLGYRPGEPLPGGVAGAVDATLSVRRVQLWNDALGYAARNPITGIGPGRYPHVSTVSRRDRDSRWPHNEFLHVAAEAGFPALLFLMGVFGAGYAMLWYAPNPRAAAVGAFALGAAGVHACVDYVFHFPAIPMMAAAIVAAAMGFVPRADEPRRTGQRTVT